MRITIVALGSRGDVQPFVALGRGLRAAGHTVRLAAATDYTPLVREQSLDFAPLVGSIRELMDPELVYQVLDATGNPLRLARHFLRAIEPLFVRVAADCRRACEGADAAILSTLGVYAAYDVVRALRIPFLAAHMHPWDVTAAFPSPGFAALPDLPRWFPPRGAYNRLTQAAAEHIFWQLLRAPLNRARREVLGRPPLSPPRLAGRARSWRAPTLYGYSPLVAPRPPDWGELAHVTGCWFLDRPADWRPPAELVAFLESGPPPIYVGFGSNLLGRDPDAVTALVLRALAGAGRRGILFSGWGDLGNGDLPASVLKVDAIPHDWLFPRVAAVVHHGGAGTTAAGLRAGRPAVVIPSISDQMFWGRRVRDLGVGPAPIPRSRLSAERLAAAIGAASGDGEMGRRAAALGERLRAEDGVARAVDIVHHYLAAG